MKKCIFILFSLFLLPAMADEGRFIVDISASKLYVYDDAGEELGEVKSSDVKKEFAEISGGDGKGMPILSEDDDEGLLQVRLSAYAEPVWVETMAVKVWPTARLKCPEVTTGRAEVEQSGMTIGFGEHCEPEGE